MTAGDDRARTVVAVAFGLFGLSMVVAALRVVGDRALTGAGVLAVAALLPAFFWLATRSGRLVGTLILAVTGLAAFTAGIATSIPHAVLAGPRLVDITGVAASLAGVVLLALAFRSGLRGRRRLTQVAIGVLASLVLAQFWVLPVMTAGLVTNTRHPAIPAASSLGLPGARDVTFSARDGVRLAGWYVPGRRSAAVVLLHGSHGTRASTLPYLRLLAHAGYAVLAFDARGHGASAGQTNALGWRGSDDIAGAMQFLVRQSGLNPRRIAALGLSMGGEEALRAAADGIPLAAVIAEGAGASTLGDQRLVAHGATAPVFLASTWLAMRATELLSGESEPAPLAHVVHRIRVPVLLVASRAAAERTIDEAFRNRIGPRAALWYVADAGHTQALREHPRAYQRRTLRFLAEALQ